MADRIGRGRSGSRVAWSFGAKQRIFPVCPWSFGAKARLSSRAAREADAGVQPSNQVLVRVFGSKEEELGCGGPTHRLRLGGSPLRLVGHHWDKSFVSLEPPSSRNFLASTTSCYSYSVLQYMLDTYGPYVLYEYVYTNRKGATYVAAPCRCRTRGRDVFARPSQIRPVPYHAGLVPRYFSFSRTRACKGTHNADSIKLFITLNNMDLESYFFYLFLQ